MPNCLCFLNYKRGLDSEMFWIGFSGFFYGCQLIAAEPVLDRVVFYREGNSNQRRLQAARLDPDRPLCSCSRTKGIWSRSRLFLACLQNDTLHDF